MCLLMHKCEIGQLMCLITFPASTVVQVLAINAGCQGVVLVKPCVDFSLDDGLGVWACLKIVSERQDILRTWQFVKIICSDSSFKRLNIA